MIRRLWCAMFGHEWVVVWRATSTSRSKTMVFCHRCETPGWEM